MRAIGAVRSPGFLRVTSSRPDETSSEFITEAGLANSTANLCRAGAVVVVVRSGILKHTLPVAVLSRPASINQDLRCLDSGSDDLNEWLALALRASSRSLLEKNREGTTVQSVKTETLRDYMLAIPPLEEQRRIVAKVEGLLGRVGAARERLARVPTLLRRFRQSVLAAACDGRLTADGSVPADAIDSSSFTRHTIADLVEANSGRPYVTSGSRGWARFVSPRGPYFIRSENINTDSLRLESAVRVNAPPGAEANRTKVRPGDLLLTITGNNVGRTAIVPGDCPDAHVSQHVAIIRLTPSVFVDYVWIWLRSPLHGQAQLAEYFYGETKPGLSLQQVKAVWVNLPSLAEQQEIVRRLDALFKLADAIERRVAEAQRRVDRITQAILAKAFRGELVPTEAELARLEGRAFESAEELLERVRGQGTVSAAKGRGRKAKPRG